MKQFFKYVFATFTGIVCFFSFLCILLGLFITAIALSDDGTPDLEEGTILRISLKGEIAERSQDNPFSDLLNKDEMDVQGLDDLMKAIRVAQSNNKVKGIYIECGALQADFATLEELRGALTDFKKSKKFIVAYADTYTQGCYYLASTADKVYLNPSGMLNWHGIVSQPIFYTDLLKKVGIKMQVFKVGTFKSAVEPFILTEMSEANRNQVSSFVDDIWKNQCSKVSASRKLSVDSLNAYADRYTFLADANDYVKLHLVDSLAYIDGVRDKLRALTGEEKINFIKPSELAQLDKKKNTDEKIAVYYAQGDIVDEPASTSSIMGETQQIVGSKVVADLDKLANDDDVKAVVLRINSGGGSAYASEQMWRAIQILKKKKPVVVSMSGMAASGGYYMSCGADYIIAEPSTLTGSIGIFGMIPDASELLTEKLGLHFDVVKTNKASDFGAMGRPFNLEEGEAMQQYVNRGYRQFLSRVAAGRHMTETQVDNIGQGRVWTGNQALKIKLVDKLGTIDDAIKEAAHRAKVKEYAITYAPQKASWMDQFMASTVKRDYLEEKLQSTLGEYYAPLSFIAHMKQNDLLQARIFYLPNLK